MDKKSAAACILPSFRTPYGGQYNYGAPWKSDDDGTILRIIYAGWRRVWLVPLLLLALAIGLAASVLAFHRYGLAHYGHIMAGVTFVLIFGFTVFGHMGFREAPPPADKRPRAIVNRKERILTLSVSGATIRFKDIAAFQLIEGDFGPLGENIAELNIITATHPPMRLNILCHRSSSALRPFADGLTAATGVPLHIFRHGLSGTTERFLEPFIR